MYHKLVVSSLEFRAQSGDLKACAELVSRHKQGMKRARLAIERLLARKIPQEARSKLCEYKYQAETIALMKQITMPVNPTDNAQSISYPLKSNTDDKDLISIIEREEFERYGNLTAQEIMNRNR